MEELFKNPQATLQDLAKTWGLKGDAVTEAASYISQQSKDQIHPIESSSVRKTYELCVEAHANVQALQSGGFDEEIARQLLALTTLMNMVSAVDLPDGRIILTTPGRAEPLVAHTYYPTGSWQTISVQFNSYRAPAVLDLYQSACVVWIRKAVIRVDGKEISAKIKAGREGILETVHGVQRLSILGPGSLLLENLPSGPVEIEIELLMQAGTLTINSIMSQIRERAPGRNLAGR